MTTRLGKFCFRHRWWLLLAWLLAMVVGVLSAGPLFASMEDNDSLNGMESVTAQKVLDKGSDEDGGITALYEQVDAPAVHETVAETANEIAGFKGVKEVDAPAISDDRRGIAVTVTFAQLEDDEASEKLVERVKATFQELEKQIPGATLRLGGSSIMGPEINEQVSKDLANAEIYSLPVTAIVLVFVFGGLIAAGIPLLATIFTVGGSFAVLLGFSYFIDLDSNMMTIVTMLGLGLSIDYGLLLVARYREELARLATWAPGATRTLTAEDRYIALGRTWGTAGRTIAFSALTVSVALVGLLFIGVPRLQAMGASGIAAALVAMATALTLTAALLRIAGKRVKPSKKELAKAAAGEVEGTKGFFATLARFTQRRPLVVTVGVSALLLAIASPLLFTAIKLPNRETLPDHLESVQVSEEIERHYGKSDDPAIVVVARTTPEELDTWAAQWQHHRDITRIEPARAAGADLSVLSIQVEGELQGPAARELVLEIRKHRPAAENWVTGRAAMVEDLVTKLKGELIWAVGFTIAATMVLLFLMTGSLLVPIKALFMSALSLGATFGILTMIYDFGWGANLIDAQPYNGLSPFMLIMIYAFATGLSMDYEVFLLGRIKEKVDQGASTDEAVRFGLQRSGKIITSAALLMMIVFAGFALADMGDIQMVGVGLFVAVLLDATIVRCLLVPATMTLLGRANWWAPAWLKKAHNRFGISEGEPPRNTPKTTEQLVGAQN
ncbi:MAG: MMPL family transporter [Corynebacteriales bacterium]|nr:MMPL family transporter [Mycobacteriales bacterium]